MDGLLIIDKGAGITSHDVVDRVRKILGTRRVGHTGTLDPFATGVMAILVGRATRLAQFLDKDEKEYLATVRFGFETDTGDVTGSPKTDSPGVKSVRAKDVERSLAQFRGVIEQLPPMYSAKKVGGKKLYESARKGLEVERKPAKVTVKALELIDPPDEADEFHIRAVCSAGTYIRVLAEDIGRSIGVRAHLTQLRRTWSGKFGSDEAVSLDDLAKVDDPSQRLLPMELAVEHLDAFLLGIDRVEATRNGLSTRVNERSFEDGQNVRMMSPEGKLLAVGVYSAGDRAVKPKVVLV